MQAALNRAVSGGHAGSNTRVPYLATVPAQSRNVSHSAFAIFELGVRRRAIPLALLAGALFSGCAALPEIGPFVDASAQLRTSVASSGDVVATELRRIEGGNKRAEELEKQWAQRVKACDALVQYADSLQAIASAGQAGRQAAQSIADSVTALAGAAGVALPGAQAVGVATDAAKFIFVQISLARAAESLERSLSAAAPAVDEIAAQISRDLKILESIVLTASDASINKATSDNNDMLGFRKNLTRMRGDVFNKLSQPLSPSLIKELEEINKLMDATRGPNEAYEKEIAGLTKRRNAATSLIRAASDAVNQWAASHRQLVAAVRERRPVNPQSLVDATRELRDLTKRIRDL
jgi:hypothetical protein